MSDGALFSGQQQKNKKRHSTAEGGGATRDSGEDREIHLCKFRQQKRMRAVEQERGLKVVRGEREGFLSSLGGVFVTSGL